MKDAHQTLDRLDLNLLVVFDALLREQSVTKAGNNLGLSQSAISHSLTRLRAYFDDPLFVKVHRGIAPTAKGEALAPVIRDVMETLREQVLSQSQFDPLEAKRSFKFCLSDMGELVFLPTLVARLKEVAPHCRIQTLQVLPDELASVLGSGEGDLAFGSVLNATEGLYQEELFTHSFVCIVSVKNKKIGKSITVAQYSDMPHIAVTLTGQSTTPYDRAVEDAGVKRDLRILTPHFLAIPLLLDQHPEYIATVPRELGAIFAHHGIVRMIEPPITLPIFALKQYWHPRFHHDRANRWLRELARKAFHKLPAPLGRR
jgi:DNA-binding transcriptional LysR family regulator